MVESDNDDVEVKCIFCQKDLERSEMVRYRGAISCKECAEKKNSGSKPISKTFFYLAGIGSLIGMVTFIFFSFNVHLFSLINPESYIQPVVPFFGGMLITIALISLGLYAINRIHLFVASIVSVLTCVIAAVSSALAVFDFVVDGPYYAVEAVIYIKTVTYYSMTLGTFSLFTIVAGLAILLHMANIRTEYLSIASASLFLLASIFIVPILGWLVTGIVNAIVYTVAFAFFMTRRRVYEEEPIQPL